MKKKSIEKFKQSKNVVKLDSKSRIIVKGGNNDLPPNWAESCY